MAYILPTLTPLCISMCIPLHSLECFIGEKRGSGNPDDGSYPPHTWQKSLHVYHSTSDSSLGNLREGGKVIWTKKPALKLMVMERVATNKKNMHRSSTAGNRILSKFSPYASLIMPTMWHFSSQKGFYLWMWLWSSSCIKTN